MRGSAHTKRSLNGRKKERYGLIVKRARNVYSYNVTMVNTWG